MMLGDGLHRRIVASTLAEIRGSLDLVKEGKIDEVSHIDYFHNERKSAKIITVSVRPTHLGQCPTFPRDSKQIPEDYPYGRQRAADRSPRSLRCQIIFSRSTVARLYQDRRRLPARRNDHTLTMPPKINPAHRVVVCSHRLRFLLPCRALICMSH